jgi:hypothetical protein
MLSYYLPSYIVRLPDAFRGSVTSESVIASEQFVLYTAFVFVFNENMNIDCGDFLPLFRDLLCGAPGTLVACR